MFLFPQRFTETLLVPFFRQLMRTGLSRQCLFLWLSGSLFGKNSSSSRSLLMNPIVRITSGGIPPRMLSADLAGRERHTFVAAVGYRGAGWHDFGGKLNCLLHSKQFVFHPHTWSKCSRTDKGVSAINNVFSFQATRQPLKESVGDLYDIISKQLHSHLNPCFTLFSLRSTTCKIAHYSSTKPDASPAEFEARSSCEKRTYHYLVDIDYLLPRNVKKREEEKRSRSLEDMSSTRTVHSMRCVGTVDNFFDIEIVGRSFAKHQIRKMMGMLLMVIKRQMPDDILPVSLKTSQKVHTPLAPSEYLYFDRPDFKGIYRGLMEVPAASREQFFNRFILPDVKAYTDRPIDTEHFKVPVRIENRKKILTQMHRWEMEIGIPVSGNTPLKSLLPKKEET
ncbi:putative tRNA pseudouridine synthase A [Planoprotostelium fungivorum]|uniref:tRNA pseudouridine synthase n=1 Tax=Planoprotostelium fungivorum TaxID=1890364 RepID=A0A2P6NXZ4_9EUKA|nr:putative tRNA pseudouridine synthase A [Planoprotostelium fungivorum]